MSPADAAARDEFPIVDPHQHFWDLGRNYHPWLCDPVPIAFRYGDYSAVKRNYLPADYRRDARRYRLVKTVHIGAVPPGCDVDALDAAVASRAAAVIGRQVIALDRRIIAVTERNGDRIAKPRVIIPAEIPEVLMRVDDGKFVSRRRIRRAHRTITPCASRGRAGKAIAASATSVSNALMVADGSAIPRPA